MPARNESGPIWRNWLFYLRSCSPLRPLWRLPFTIPVRLGPFTVYADLFRNISFIINRGWAREFEERRSFVALFKRFGVEVFWDVGANLGMYSLIFLQHKPGGTVLAFEPDQRNLALLRKTIQRNSLSSLKAVPLAVSDNVGEAPFFTDDITGETGTLTNSYFVMQQYKQAPIKTIVATTTLDEQLETERCPDFIKIDVEGNDLAVFHGGIQMINVCRPIIMFEATSKTFPETRRLLEAAQYRLLNPATLRELEEGETAFNVIALHRVRHCQ